jgi:hypothetical protein
MAQLDLVRLAGSTDELLGHVTDTCAAPALVAAAAVAPRAADLVLDSPRRVAPVALWRLRLAHYSATLMIVLGAGVWTLSTDEVTALAAKVIGVHTVVTVPTNKPDVGLVVRTSQSSIPAVASHLSRLGLHATFALPAVPTAVTIQTLRALGDTPMCEVDRARALRWMQTGGKLRLEQRALHLRRHFFYLAPQNGPSVGQLILAKHAGATPVKGSVQVSAAAPVPARPLRRGDVAIVTVDGSPASLRSLDRFAAELAAERLSGVSFATLEGGA